MSQLPLTIQERIPLPAEPMLRPAGASASAFSPQDILRAIKQRIFLILFVWLFLCGVTVGGTYLWMKHYPSFRAQAQVWVISPRPQMPYTLQEIDVSPDVQERILQDQAIQAKSDEVLRQVLQDPSVQATAWYRSYKVEDRPQMLIDLKEKLEVVPYKGTSYLLISMSCRSSNDLREIVNAVVDKYVSLADVQARARYNEQLGKYRDEGETLKKQIAEKTQEKMRLLARELGGVPGVTQGLNVVAEALRSLTVEAARLESEKYQLQAMNDTLQSAGAKNLAISPQMRMMIESDPTIVNLRNMLGQLQQTRRLMTQSLGPKHRQVVELDSQIAAIEQQLEEEQAIKIDQVRQYEVDSAQMAYLNATQADLRIQERLMDYKEQQKDLDRQLATLQAIEEERQKLERRYDMVEEYRQMLELMLSQSRTIRVQVSSASRPIEMSLPRWELNVPIGVLLGLVIAVGLALLLELSDTSVRTPRDIVRHINIPILGTVPDTDDEEVPIERVELAAHTAPQSMIAEAFRSIRTNLLLSAPAERQRTVLITSPKPEDGKTTVAANLAISIAQSGRRVLLIDTNFRRPMIHQVFGGGPREGLSNALVGQAKLADLVRKTALPNLDVLPSGPIPPNPSELLSSSYMRDLIAQAVDRYDQIILDGPPVLLVSDALVMAGMLDGVILVCRAKANSRGVAQRARDQLERVHAHLFGAILNGAQVRRGGYFREQFRTYYEYQSAELPAGTAVALPSGPEELPRNEDRPTA